MQWRPLNFHPTDCNLALPVKATTVKGVPTKSFSACTLMAGRNMYLIVLVMDIFASLLTFLIHLQGMHNFNFMIAQHVLSVAGEMYLEIVSSAPTDNRRSVEKGTSKP